MTKPEAWQQIIGNAQVKRACEVALAGRHSITIVGHPENGEDALKTVLEGLLTFARPCGCGWIGDVVHHCHCSVKGAVRYQHSKRFQQALASEIVTRITTPPASAYDNPGESFEAVERRIKAASVFPATMDQHAKTLFAAAVDRFGLTVLRAQNAWRVAGTIAALAGATEIEAHHIAEAVQYQHREGMQ